MPGNADYTVSACADVDDVDEILAFYAAHSAPGVRKVDRAELTMLVEQGLFYVARSTVDNMIVGTVYLSEQITDGRLEHEIGGGLVAKGHQESGIARCLGICAIAVQRLKEARNEGGARPIVGRVECSNQAPIREALEGLGFKRIRKTKIKARAKPGLDEMPHDENGHICVEEFEFDDTNLRGVFEEAMHYRDDGKLRTRKKRKRCRVDLDLFAVKVDAQNPEDPLRDALADLP